MRSPSELPVPARVVLLAGPSGSGKTYVARSSRLPTVALDDFYLDGATSGLPLDADGTVDWEDPRTWDADTAVAALVELCRVGRVEVPNYRFGLDRADGRRWIDRGETTIVVAEGIFAAELVRPLDELGLLADALLVRQPCWLTFARRLARDLRERRKPPWLLVRHGWAKAWAEPAIVAHHLACGARPVTKRAARARLGALAADADAASVAIVGPAGIEPATKGL